MSLMQHLSSHNFINTLQNFQFVFKFSLQSVINCMGSNHVRHHNCLLGACAPMKDEADILSVYALFIVLYILLLFHLRSGVTKFKKPM